MPAANANVLRSTVALLLVGLLTLLAIVGTALWLVGRTEAYAERLVDMQRIRAQTNAVVRLVQDAEAGQRGYLLTQETQYLEPYEEALAGLAAALANLREVAGSRQEYVAPVDRLADLIAVKLAEINETLELVEAGRMDDAMAIVRTDRGRTAMEAVRRASADMIGSIDTAVSASASAMRSSARTLTAVLILGGLLIVAVVGGATWVAWRYTRALQRAQEEVQALNVTLEERVRERTGDVARANEEIQRFAYIVSHDLRSPLVNIMGFTSELEAGLAAVRTQVEQLPPNSDDPAVQEARTAVDADMPEAIGFIRASTGKMDNLINAILSLSREGRRRLTPERIEMRELFETAAATVRHQLAEQGGQMEVVAPLPEISSDRLALEQVFGNLIDNAVKYLDPERPGRITIRGEETRTGVVYEVEDNGRGIAPQDKERVFELFRRAGPQDIPGEGIGLSTVRALVRRLGGDIGLESSLGKGTIFRVRLPRTLPLLRESA